MSLPRYSEREHTMALAQHDCRYAEMKRVACRFGRRSPEYEQARSDVVAAARVVREAARRPKS